MKLLLVTQYYWPESFIVTALAEELQRRGHQVTVLTGFPNYPSGEFQPGYDPNKGVMREKRNGVDIVRIPIWPRGKSKFGLALNYLSFILSGFWACLFLKLDSVDAIFCYAPSPATSCLTAIFMKWRLRKKLYIWVQDLWPESISAVGALSEGVSNFIFGGLICFIYKNCDKILIPSEGFRESVKRWSGKDQQIELIANWADPFPEMKEVPSWVSSLPRGFRVTFAGNLGKAQDIPTLVTAVEILKSEKDMKWIIAGDGSEKTWFENEVQKRNLQEAVFFVGQKPYAEMLPLFKNSDALYVSLRNQPNFALTIPTKVQAYMASGIPLVAALNGEGKKLIESSRCGLVSASEDANGLVENILRLKRMSQQERDQLGKNGKKYFDSHFERKLIITQIENLISEGL